MILPRRDYPLYLAKLKPIIKGIAIGECRDKFYFDYYGEEPFASHMPPARCVGHAHSEYDDPYVGWICIRTKQLCTKTTLLHEVAHLIANSFHCTPAHGRAWRKALKEIGGSDEGRDFDQEIAEAQRR